MSPPIGLSRNEEEDDDAALIDSFFLPGGILDPDDDDKEEEEEEDGERREQERAGTSRFASSQHPGTSRVPSNPWSNNFLDETPANGQTPRNTECSNDALLINCIPTTSGGRLECAGNAAPVPVARPPPGYTNRPESLIFFGSEAVIHQTTTELTNQVQMQNVTTSQDPVHSAQDNNDMPYNEGHAVSELHLPSRDPVDGPPPGFQDKTIRRPHQSILPETTELEAVVTSSNGLDPGEKYPLLEAMTTKTEEVFENFESSLHLVGVPRGQGNNGRSQLGANPFMDFIDPDSDGDKSETEKSVIQVLETAEEMEGTGDLDVQEDDDEGEDEDIHESTREDSPFPMHTLTFVNSQSTTSSISTSSDSGSDQDESQHSLVDDDNERAFQIENMDEITEALDSGVAVILDVFDSTEHGIKSVKAGREDDRSLPISSNHCKQNNKEEHGIPEKSPAASLPDSTIQNNLREFKGNVITYLSVWRNTFHEYSAWMKDFTEVMAVLTAATWNAISHVMASANKVLAFSSLFLYQVWKFALVEVIEEPKVTICYIVFYFMPYFCSILLKFFVIPHWTPHFITTVAVWSLCSQITAGPIHIERIHIHHLPYLLFKNGGMLSTEVRPRDERACQTILRVLRLVLPIFFFADGFSTEFGTIMGVSGSSRLTTAYMMSLVRKSLVSSPIGWISWAVQVLLATHHPSSILSDFFVLISGLSSIRLIRYLEVRRSGNKKRQGKQH